MKKIINILICEDNKLTLKALSVTLEKAGYKVFTACDGNEALYLLNQRMYNLVVADIHLPYRSGLELVRYLRSDLGRNTPVIVLSAFSDPNIKLQAKNLGANLYLEKPFNTSDLLQQIKSLL